jgi:hypothetical protein
LPAPEAFCFQRNTCLTPGTNVARLLKSTPIYPMAPFEIAFFRTLTKIATEPVKILSLSARKALCFSMVRCLCMTQCFQRKSSGRLSETFTASVYRLAALLASEIAPDLMPSITIFSSLWIIQIALR